VTKEELDMWLELGKIAASMATPIVVAVVGILLLRRIEGIKAAVAKQSEFHQRWADEFFACCQGFMQALERDMALLTMLARMEDPNGKLGAKLQEEVSRLHPKLSELELRIRRSVVFAPSSGGAVTKSARECITLTGKLIASRKGSADDIIKEMNEFNIASRKAHAEMLGLGAAEQGAAEGVPQAARL